MLRRLRVRIRRLMDVGWERVVRIEVGWRAVGMAKPVLWKDWETLVVKDLVEASMLLATSLGEAGRVGMRDLRREGVVGEVEGRLLGGDQLGGFGLF